MGKKKDNIIIERHYIEPDDQDAVEIMVQKTVEAYKILAEILQKGGKEKLLA